MLDHYVCENCGTASAAPEPPARCGECDAATFTELQTGNGAAAYFAGALRGRTETSPDP